MLVVEVVCEDMTVVKDAGYSACHEPSCPSEGVHKNGHQGEVLRLGVL